MESNSSLKRSLSFLQSENTPIRLLQFFEPKMRDKWEKKQLDHSSPPQTTAGIIHDDDGVMKFIMFGCVAIGVVVKLLPYEYREGINPVPTVIFKEIPTTTFHTFIISIMLAFTGAFSCLLTKRRLHFSNYEKFCRCYSLVFAAVAMAILVNAGIRSAFCQGIQLVEA
ncbi:uncharacterized protein LOC125370886 [Ricinus communis]|uniref:uncharacterized protein LOC125370886 n=1 Tax=Ricinus communis TaxID=3988 RepID=UPI00201AB209|nr:uncharacterized protein LOC125370886 [Ricinus communis]